MAYNMNFDWQYHDGDLETTAYESVHETRFKSPIWMKAGNCGVAKWGYDTSDWDNINVPHDFRVYRGEYDPENVPEPEGFLKMGIVWYRKAFFVDKSHEGKCISIEFDGVYRDSEIYVNGHFVGRHLSGYTSFHYDISDVIRYGQPNVVAVRVNATNYEGWWYEAAGIYRDVRLVITEPIYVKKDGIFVRTYMPMNSSKLFKERKEIPSVLLKADIDMRNDTPYEGMLKVEIEVVDPYGVSVMSNYDTVKVDAYEDKIMTLEDVIIGPKLWDIDSPRLYTLFVTIKKDDQVMDTQTLTFGIKDVQFTSQKGIYLNGRSIKIQGVCVHDDFAAVGGALTESTIRHKIQILKNMGCNAYRCSHNPPSPYLLKACDDIGILVMDEVRLMSTADEYIKQMTDLFKRDRNHASIFIWSIGNEEMNIHGTPTGVRIMKKLQRLAHRLDDTRPITYGNNCNWYDITKYHENHDFHIDVFGFNYYVNRQFDLYDKIHAEYPDRCILGTENGSGQSTRGQYLPREEELNPDYYSERSKTTSIWANPKRKYNVSAYTESYPLWGSTPLETLKAADKNYVAGYFVWTGFDYRGEIFPFTWPSVIARYGIIDLCGFMKDSGHQYRVHWTKEPSIHLMPHWTFDCVGEEIEVVITANTQEIEFICNGTSYGRKPIAPFEAAHYFVHYEPGEIIALGYNDGIEVVRESHKTASEPKFIQLQLVSDYPLRANGEDTIMVQVKVLDAFGIDNPSASNRIDFQIEGVGEIVGCGNGDPLCHDHDHNHHRALFNGLVLVVLKTTRQTGTIRLTASSDGLMSDTMYIQVTEKADDQLVPAVKDATLEVYDTKDAADGGL